MLVRLRGKQWGRENYPTIAVYTLGGIENFMVQCNISILPNTMALYFHIVIEPITSIWML